ncbi:hypothetical protein GCM10009744_03250 [Kribbella alba]|uniref:Uncharacterized protein n=1 Tax=Kribbella alba TaxID=190197 RepID=A0ABN2EW28_9ACTN
MTLGTGRSSNRVASQRGTFAGKDIRDGEKSFFRRGRHRSSTGGFRVAIAAVVGAMSPRAVDKRARPGNEGALVVQGEIALPVEPGGVVAAGPSADLAAVGAVERPGEQVSGADEPAE